MKYIIKILFVLLSVFFYSHNVQAVGLSPPIVEIKDVSKATPYQVKVKLFNDQQSRDQDLYLLVQPHGEYAHYIKGEKSFVIPANESPAEYTFFIDAKDAAIGKYEVMLNFMTTSKPITDTEREDGKISNRVTVVQGVGLVVRFNVSGKQVVDFKLLNSQMLHTEVNLPLYLAYTMQNIGNVDWKPDKILALISDIDDASKREEIIIPSQDIELTSPGETKKNQFDLKHNLPLGNYRAMLEFYNQKGDVVGSLKSQKFNVYPPGSLKQLGNFVSLDSLKKRYKPGEKIKLNAIFKNTGKVPVTGILILEIYKKDELLDIARSSELNISVNEKAEFSKIIELDDFGKYNISAYIEYGNKKTGSKSIDIQIDGKELSTTTISILLASLIFIIAIIAFLFKRFRAEKTMVDDDIDDEGF